VTPFEWAALGCAAFAVAVFVLAAVAGVVEWRYRWKHRRRRARRGGMIGHGRAGGSP
jgi:hypothetical protein